MVKLGFYEFITSEDVLLIALVGLVLVLRNWWDLIRDGLARVASAAAAPVLQPKHIAPGYAARIPRALRVLRRAQSRRAIPRPVRPGHRPVRHAV